jgi:peptidoglycan/xylan/chitin deacetylase (PgdA/CDA1 family)
LNWFENKLLGLFVKTNGLLSEPLFGGMGHVFMLHRVLPEHLRDQYTINRGLAITPEYLEECIQYFISKKYRFISLDELHHIITSGAQQQQKFICFTMDDGYKDNLEYALPLFKKYDIPFTIYITNCFANRTAILWWYLLEQVIQTKSEFELNIGSETITYKWSNFSEGEKLYPEIRKKIRQIPRSIYADSLKTAFMIDDDFIKKSCDEQALSWDEIKQLSNESIVTIGAHTMNHLSLATLSETDLNAEMEQSKLELENKIGKPVEHFAYPYGGFEDAHIREYKAAGTLGFKTAVLNYPGNVFSEHKKSTMAIPRYALGNNTDRQKLDFYLNGIQHFSMNGFRKAIAY